MGQELHGAYSYVRDFFADIERHSDISIPDHFFGSGSRELHENGPAQVGLFGVAIALMDVLAHEFDYVPDAVVGYSLGTYAAMVTAGCLDRWGALEVLLEVQRLLDTGRYPGAMGYVIGLRRPQVVDMIESIAPGGEKVRIGNENAPQQFVLTGEAAAVCACIEEARPFALAAEVLPISSPMHSPRLLPLTDELARFVEERIEVRAPSPSVALYAPMLGRRVTTQAEAVEVLCRQIARPSYWEATLRMLWTNGCHKFIEAGPSHVLAKMLRWTLRQAKVQVLEDPLSVEKFALGRHARGAELLEPRMPGEST